MKGVLELALAVAALFIGLRIGGEIATRYRIST